MAPKYVLLKGTICSHDFSKYLVMQLVVQCQWQQWSSVELHWNLRKLIHIMFNTCGKNTKLEQLMF